MSKLGIVTFHHAKFSYGAMLQAYATEAVCRRFVDDVEIIDYENPYEQKGAKTASTSAIGTIKKNLNYLLRLTVFQGYRNQYRNSKNIDKFYHKVSSKKYEKIEDFCDADYDILLSGSDQIWSPELTNGVDEVFLLNFGNQQKRISYASSMGSYILNEEEQQKFAECLSRFDSISVREAHAKEQLQPLTQKDIEVVLDPTLLLRKEEWEEQLGIQSSAKTKEPYILTFFVSTGLESYWDQVGKYVSELGLPVWNVQSHKHKSVHVDKVVFAPSVSEFVELIANASVIITNSFHGTAFSLNFQKNVVPILSKKNPARVVNLLNMCGLSELIDIAPERLHEDIDYREANALLEQSRKKSLMWLENALKD